MPVRYDCLNAKKEKKPMSQANESIKSRNFVSERDWARCPTNTFNEFAEQKPRVP